jgi:hypothetical protein
MKTLTLSIFAFFEAVLILFSSSSGAATQWKEIGRTEDKVARIFLAEKFSTISGKFNAVSYSGNADEQSLTGKFIVGAFLFLHDEPTAQNGITYDGIVTEIALDCNRHFSATLKESYYLEKKLIKTVEVPKLERLMVQLQPRGTKIENALCNLHKKSS